MHRIKLLHDKQDAQGQAKHVMFHGTPGYQVVVISPAQKISLILFDKRLYFLLSF